MNDKIKSGLSGGTAGIVTDLIFFPIETIKTRLQASSAKVNYTESAKQLSKYRGLISQMTVSFPAAFIFFYSYDFAKSKIDSPFKPMLAGMFGEVMANLFRNPFEVVKNQMQVGLDHSIRNTIQSVLQVQGFRGFYAGLSSILLREIPFSAIQFPIYEYMKKRSDITPLNGMVAGSIAAFCTTPCDVLKSKLMTQRSKFYSNIFDCASQIYKEEGLKGFFRAAHIRTAQIGFSGILFFSAYETAKKLYSNL